MPGDRRAGAGRDLFVTLFGCGHALLCGQLFFMRVRGETGLFLLSSRAPTRLRFRLASRARDKVGRESVLLPASAMTAVKPISPAESRDSDAFLGDFRPAPTSRHLFPFKPLFSLTNIYRSGFASKPCWRGLSGSIA
jgi:hypothetical protein